MNLYTIFEKLGITSLAEVLELSPELTALILVVMLLLILLFLPSVISSVANARKNRAYTPSAIQQSMDEAEKMYDTRFEEGKSNRYWID